MVLLQVKRENSVQFSYETNLSVKVEKLLLDVVAIFNGRLKVDRICSEMEQLANHGCLLPPEILGLAEEQVDELKLVDVWADKCVPSGGFIENKDPVGRRNGRRPNDKMKDLIMKTIGEAKELIKSDKTLVLKDVQEAINLLKGAVTIVYPMQLPPHDTIRNEFQNTEDLTGTQASKEVIEPAKAQLWFAGRQLLPDKNLCDFLGKNEKCKVVVKLTKKTEGAPAREPVLNSDDQKAMMMYAYKKQEELKKLEQDDDDSYLDAGWARGSNLRSQLQGMSGDVKFKFGK